MSFLLQLVADFVRDGITQLALKAWKKPRDRAARPVQQRKQKKMRRKKRYE